MDTKWKKFRNNTAIKVIAFLLTCVFAFISFYSLLQAVLFGSQYSNRTDITMFLTDYENSSFTNSNAFRMKFDGDAEAISKMIMLYINDDYVSSGKAFEQVEARLKKEMEESIKERTLERKRDIIDNAIIYDDEGYAKYNFKKSEISSEATTEFYKEYIEKYDITTINGRQYYKGFPLDAVVVDEVAIRKEAESTYKDNLSNEKMNFRDSYENNKEAVNKLVNLKYVIRNRKTGEIFTNTGKQLDPNIDLNLLINQNSWYALIQDGSFRNGNYNNDSQYELYNNTREQASQTLSGNFDDNGFDAYFELDNSNNAYVKGDAYYNMHQDYETRLATVEDMRTYGIVFSVLTLLMIIFLCIGAGKLDDEGKTIKAKIDKLYNDFHFLISSILIIGGSAIVVLCFDEFAFNISAGFNGNLFSIGCALLATAVIATLIEWLMSVVRHVRCSTYWKHTFIYVLFIKNAKRLKALCQKLWVKTKELFTFKKTKNLKDKMVRMIALYAVANVVLAFLFGSFSNGYNGFLAFLVFVGLIVLNVSLIITAKGTIQALDDMMEALIQAEQGKFDFDLNVYAMPMYLRDFATHILNLREGIKIAVDEAIKGERMKAELITNVSHDLKTPLTSIVSYVDLLKRCELQDEAAKGYVTILEEKAERLKKLIEDLVEASKVSTGNIQLNITKVNLNELAAQLTGENEDDLTALGIEMRVTTPETPAIVNADSQKAYRAIENLFSNVKKYAMPGTRVYVEVGQDEDFGYISVKNISRDALDIPVEQLTQRFVRGDSARTSEGSGLGLSIADNLVTLQNGEFKLELDGDLFKATIRLPLNKNSQ